MSEKETLVSLKASRDTLSSAGVTGGRRASIGVRGSTKSITGVRHDDAVAGDRQRRTGASRYREPSLAFPDEVEDAAQEKADDSDFAFEFNHTGLTSAEAKIRLQTFGPNELPDNSKSKWVLLGELLIQPMACMLWVSAIAEAIVSNYLDMGILIGINLLNAGLSFYETVKAGDAVAALKASLKPVATCKRNGQWVAALDASELVPGDLVLLAAGSSIPADCRINKGSGTLQVDQSGLTGESLPVTMVSGDDLNHPKMGSTVIKGEVEATVEHTGLQTVMGQTAALLNTGDTLSNLQRILIKIVSVLSVLSLILSIVVFIVILKKLPGNAGYVDQRTNETNWKTDLGFTVVLLVSSMPLAVEIVTTTTLALGSGMLSKDGAIVSRLTAIEDLAGMDILCSDKTGTLTTNNMELQKECPTFRPDTTQHDVIQLAAMAAKWKEPPRDALDRLVLGAADLDALKNVRQPEFIPFDPELKRTEATVTLENGQTFKVTKGAPHVVIDLCEKTEEEYNEMHHQQMRLAERGIRAMMIAQTNEEGTWRPVAMLTFLDPARPDSKATIIEAAQNGVPLKMITGDHALIAKEMANTLQIQGEILGPENLPMLNDDGSIPQNLVRRYGRMIKYAGGFAQVFPQHKYLIVHCLRRMGFKCGMTGDGVNDAPALKAADVGIAVSGATDAARLAADIVLTRPGLYTIINGIVVAREIFQRIYNFLIYRIAASLQLLFFFFFAVLIFPPNKYAPMQPSFQAQFPGDSTDPAWEGNEWIEVFKMPVLLLMLITVLNDGTLVTIGYDTVKASPRPCVWRLPVLFIVSFVLAAVACISSLILLWGGLDSWNPNQPFRKLGLVDMSFGQVVMMMYLKVSVSDFLTLFSARGGETFVFSGRRPALILAFAGFIALLISTLISLYIKGQLDHSPVEGLKPKFTLIVWGYCLVCWIVQDLAKVATYRFLRAWNFFGINSSAQSEDSDLFSYAPPNVGMRSGVN